MGDSNSAENPLAGAIPASLKERRRVASERLQAAEARREKLALEQADADEVEEMERDAADAEAIADMEAKHGKKKIHVVNTDLGCVIIKRPEHVMFKRFLDKGSTKYDEINKLVRSCLVHPTKAAFDLMLEEQAGILGKCADAASYLAGIKTREDNEKS